MTDRERIIKTLRASGYGFFVTHKKANADEALADTADALIENGYRKQSDTVKEFVCKVLQIGSKRPLCLFNEYGEGYIDCIENIKKIAKEYGVEVEEQ